MKILVLYATTEGQTRKIAEFVAARFPADDVKLLDATAAPSDLDPARFDVAILAASIHAHRYQQAIVTFARAHHAALSRMPALFLSVSLSAAGDDPEDLAGIAQCAAQFQAETGWTGARVLHVAGAFRFTRYDFFKGLLMRHIARAKGVKLAPHEDLELTDWDDLAREVDAFRQSLTP